MATWSPWNEAEQYVWAVICKNRKFHARQNMFSGHKIPLGATDALTPPPEIDCLLTVRCDDCGEENQYDPADLVRLQMEIASDFKPHPLFG
jgi:hypothetical protein